MGITQNNELFEILIFPVFLRKLLGPLFPSQRGSSIRAERSRKKCSLSHLALYKFLKHPPEALVSSGSIISNKNNKYSKVLFKCRGVGGGCIVKRRKNSKKPCAPAPDFLDKVRLRGRALNFR